MSVRRKEKNALHLRKEAAQAHPHIDNRILEGRKSEGYLGCALCMLPRASPGTVEIR